MSGKAGQKRQNPSALNEIAKRRSKALQALSSSAVDLNARFRAEIGKLNSRTARLSSPRDARRPPASVSVPTDSVPLHAAAEINCGSCRYAKPLKDNEDVISCQRFPPLVTAVVGNQVSSTWPLLSKTNWCGEHAP